MNSFGLEFDFVSFNEGAELLNREANDFLKERRMSGSYLIDKPWGEELM